MAGEWIKLERTTLDKPEVLRIARMLKIDRDTALGKLVRLWTWFDANSVDGVVDGVVDADVDRMCFCEGFAGACVAVGWLIVDVDAERITLPNFARHNGETAKQRALKNRRQAHWRAGVDGDVDKPASTRPSTKASTREEKRREDKDQEPSSAATPADPPVDLGARKAERLAQVTDEAVAAYNATLTAPHGVLPVVTRAGREKRQAEVKRCLRVVRRICAEQYQSATVTPEFWTAYFAEVARDDFKSGRQSPGRGHENWKPGFEYLTREATVLEVFERAMSEAG